MHSLIVLRGSFYIFEIDKLGPQERQRFRNLLLLHNFILEVKNFHTEHAVKHNSFKRIAEHSRLPQQENDRHQTDSNSQTFLSLHTHLDHKKEKLHPNANHTITQTGKLNYPPKEKATTKTQITTTRKNPEHQTEKS